MRGGSYLVARRIRMLDRVAGTATTCRTRSSVIGRHKVSGAPLGGTHEHDAPDLAAKGPTASRSSRSTPTSGWPAPGHHGGKRILRRGYSFTDGIDPVTGELDAGLFFLAYQQDPRTQFVPIQAALSASRRAQRVHRARPAARSSPCRRGWLPGSPGAPPCWAEARPPAPLRDRPSQHPDASGRHFVPSFTSL